LDTFEREMMIVAHDNPIGTLVAAKGMLFGGSLKVIKVSVVYAADCEPQCL